MSEPEDLTLRMLRDIREVLGRVAEDVANIKVRVTSLEIGVAGLTARAPAGTAATGRSNRP
jgi:hypothetical protein